METLRRIDPATFLAMQQNREKVATFRERFEKIKLLTTRKDLLDNLEFLQSNMLKLKESNAADTYHTEIFNRLLEAISDLLAEYTPVVEVVQKTETETEQSRTERLEKWAEMQKIAKKAHNLTTSTDIKTEFARLSDFIFTNAEKPDAKINLCFDLHPDMSPTTISRLLDWSTSNVCSNPIYKAHRAKQKTGSGESRNIANT
jgi:hypothetical protein